MSRDRCERCPELTHCRAHHSNKVFPLRSRLDVDDRAGKDPLTGRRRYLREVVPAGAKASSEADKIMRRPAAQVDERRNPRTDATLDQLLDRYLETVDVGRTTRWMYGKYLEKHIRSFVGRLKAGVVDAEVLDSLYDRTAPLHEAESSHSKVVADLPGPSVTIPSAVDAELGDSASQAVEQGSELIDASVAVEVLLLQAFDRHGWSPELGLRLRILLETAERRRTENDWPFGVAEAVDRELYGRLDRANLDRWYAELTAQVQRLDQQEKRLDELMTTMQTEDSGRAALKVERAIVLRGRHRWGLRVVRFALGVAVGSVVAGPLVALVPWPAMVGEIVKGAIGGATGVLTSEISDPASDWAEKRLQERELARQREDDGAAG